MPEGGNIAGYRLADRSRASDVGVWVDAVAPDGARSGALRLDPRALSGPGARDRVVAAVVADRHLTQNGVTGLLPVSDLVAAGGEVWVLTARPAIPSLDDLARGRPPGDAPDAGSAATVLVETAQTLLAVHAAGLAHGALHAGTVVVGEDGTALLAERGLATALYGGDASPERDVAAWAALARGLASGWAAGSADAVRLLEHAAATAESRGLSAARDALLSGRELLPAGFTTRERLVRTLQWWSASDVPTGRPAPPVATGPQADEGEIVTLLYRDTGSGQAPPPGLPGHAAAIGAAAAASGIPDTTPAGAAGTTGGEMRFGPGVPSDTTAAQIWRAGQQQLTVAAKDRLGAKPPKRRRRGGLLGTGVLFLAILALALYLWSQRAAPLSVEAVEVTAPKPKGCDVTVNIVGKVTTNGGAGQIKYQWWRSDRKAPIEQTDTVPSGATTYELNFPWRVKGEGTQKYTARLVVLSPTGSGTPLRDQASFTYKC
ncbi:hypothetical protein Skr01_63200 [Sphaerisporangium krabiense]|uniref:Uncharacterized protein n=1 Tax=Sphaerisporangium krabiense TaxID=763782 RepID=A0A7W9DSB0_9ACTN|nr:hypothetical protein [Sphaerisporangium krabiense]MBB5628240.1 hypothetical protein [Sphaerisporangium krabiense]GII66235.1 hypothetical protein Skr01_63200 [Sphaerisporangium krabiense]